MPTDVPGDVAGLDDTLSVPPDSRPREPEPEVSRRIGPYRLLHLIGEGGMGEVWVAEQLEPVRRKVALKVIKAGMDTKQVVARFEAERQALALMDHPAIAKVLDGGSTAEGRPYFVMEYVPGVSLTEHCDTHRLPTEERLKLFMEVCEGVQHAHQKAVIHRDLKPSNILVSLVDARAQPKIIDFGIAKATGHRLTEKTLFTEVGSVIGTPEYMSPEQADLTGQDIDTRTDVYSLGVILYQLLTGELPFGSADLRSSSYEELRRKLREVDPPRPSTRLATLGEGATEAARKRETDPGSLRKQLEGDLDAITMKALEKERARRYGTASELALDIARYLRDEPVLARPPSRTYGLHKYVRRHRLAVGVAVGLAILVLAFAGATIFQVRRITAERDRANVERDWARAWVDHARDLAGAGLAQGPLTAKDGLTLEYQKTLDTFLWRARSLREKGDARAAELLARDTLALAHRLLDRETFFTVWARNELAAATIDQGRFAEAETVLRVNLTIGRRVLGADFPMVGWTSIDLARTLVRQGKNQEALDLLGEALDGGLIPRHAAHIAQEKDFAPLRADPAFEALLAKARRQHPDPQEDISAFMNQYPERPPFEAGLESLLKKGTFAPRRPGRVKSPNGRSLRWVLSADQPLPAPFDQGPSTKEGDRVMTVCRARYTWHETGRQSVVHSLIIGKTWSGADGCKVPLSGLEVTFEHFERLVGFGGEWKSGRNHSYPAHSAIAGYSPLGIPYLICQAKTSDDASHPGTLAADGLSNCTFGFGNKAVEKNAYAVLTTTDDSIPNTGTHEHPEDPSAPVDK